MQFGEKLIAFPRVAGKLALMAAETMVARQLTYFAAREKDSGRRCDIEAGMAKLLAARVAWSNADNALQIHGGNGYALEYPISRVLCDARILNIFEGAAEIQAQIIARGLARRPQLAAGRRPRHPFLPVRLARRAPAGDAAEDGAGHQAGAAGVVVVEEPADDLAGGVEAGDRVAGRVLDLGVVGDLEAAEGEGDAGRHGIGLVGRLVEALGPVGLVDREAAGRAARRGCSG